MKLVFYSGGDDKDNRELDIEFINLIDKKNPLVTFIPSSSYLSEVEFKEFVRHYSKYGIRRFLHFPIDIPFDQIMFKEVLKSDAIHLAGGNTFYFLKTLRKAKLLSPIKKFVENGGVLTGLSAGAIIMTENIELAGYPEFDRDENSVHLKNLASMNLVDFCFFPHFRNSARYDQCFKAYSRKYQKIMYGCPDGSGVVVSGDKTTFVGRCYGFYRGKKFQIN